VALYKEGESVDRLGAGEPGIVILDSTPFYAESGGQVGDRGILVAGQGAVFLVADTRKQGSDVFGHIGHIESGELHVGDSVDAHVNRELRIATQLNHSATHLMHAALRLILGDHVQQKGSLVNAERLRFDFSHFEPLTRAQLQRVEQLVNAQIRANNPAQTQVMSLDDAKASGAMALFGEKYADDVRVLRLGDFSVELCGGTHVNAAGDIGLFRITNETGIASGVRRIEAVTGARAVELIEEEQNRMLDLADLLKTGRDDVTSRVSQLLSCNRELEKELEKLKSQLAVTAGTDLASQAVEIAGIKVLAAKLDGADAKSLRHTLDQLKNKLGTAVILLIAVNDGKVTLIAGVSKDITGKFKAGDLVKAAAEKVGGKGGGRPDMAQAGGSNPDGVPQALQLVETWVAEQAAQK
jgi:alanyl-tRNA synthetase